MGNANRQALNGNEEACTSRFVLCYVIRKGGVFFRVVPGDCVNKNDHFATAGKYHARKCL